MNIDKSTFRNILRDSWDETLDIDEMIDEAWDRYTQYMDRGSYGDNCPTCGVFQADGITYSCSNPNCPN